MGKGKREGGKVLRGLLYSEAKIMAFSSLVSGLKEDILHCLQEKFSNSTHAISLTNAIIHLQMTTIFF